MGSAYVNDFNKFGRTYQVRVQADPAFRSTPDDIRRLDVRTRQGEMVPLGALVTVEESLGPQIVERYNLYPSASITGQAAPGYSSGQALTLMEQMMVPLVIASGAGAAGRRALGTAVFGGLVAATVFIVFFAPLLYVLMQRLSEWRSENQDTVAASELGVRE